MWDNQPVSNGVSLRNYEDADLSFLIALRAMTMRPHILNAGAPYDDPPQMERVLYRLDCAQIIVNNGRAIGLLKVVRDSDPWELAQIQLLPEHQGMGIGTELIRSVLDEAQSMKMSVSLVVLNSSPAQRVYQRLGFQVHDVREHVYEMRWRPIVAYAVQDQEAVEAFFVTVWKHTRFPFDPARNHSDLRRIQSVYQIDGGGFWLMRNPEIIGTVGLRRLSSSVAEIKRLNVSENHRRHGFGTRLLRQAITHAVEAGIGRVRLDTRREGAAAHLFRKLGFSEIDRYYDNPVVDLFMELDLGHPLKWH